LCTRYVSCTGAGGEPGAEPTTASKAPAGMIGVSDPSLNPGIFGGKPIIRGMRLAVEHVLEMLAAEMTAEEILHEYEFVEPEDIRACLLYAHRSVAGECIFESIVVQKTS